MAEKNIKTRIIHKHDTEENWNKATNFIPKQGEIIVYDIDLHVPHRVGFLPAQTRARHAGAHCRRR